MATGRKIREGLFLISWNPSSDNYNQRDINKEVVQQLYNETKDIFAICKLSSKEEKSAQQSQVVLEVEIVLGKSMKSRPFKSIAVLAGTIGKGKEREYQENIVQLKQQKMLLIGSKWRTSWIVSAFCNGNNCRNNGKFPFEILVDFDPFPVGVLQKAITKKTQLLNLWKTTTPHDVIIECQDTTTFKTHSFILANGSPVLAAMFHHDCKENENKVVEIKDIQSSVFGQLLHYFYTGDADLENADVAELMIAADKYAIDSLKEECGQHLSQNLTVGNACQYLVLAHTINAVKLRESSLDFMAKNAKAICSRREEWIGVIKNYPELCLEVMLLMSNI